MPTVFVTGANRGIGFEHARQYAEQGWKVLACARDPGNAAALQQLSEDYTTGMSYAYRSSKAGLNMITRGIAALCFDGLRRLEQYGGCLGLEERIEAFLAEFTSPA